MTEPPEDLTEMERLAAEFTEQMTEDEAIDLFYRMQRYLYEQIKLVRKAQEQSSSYFAFDGNLMSEMGEFYNSYCDASDAEFIRAKKVWWCLMEGLLQFASDDPMLLHGFWLPGLRWISLDSKRWDPFDVDQLMRMFFDAHLGPILLDDCYFEEGDDEERKSLQDAAERYLKRQNIETLQAMLPAWLDEEEA